MADITYIDQYIKDGLRDPISMGNFYDSILIGEDSSDKLFRVPLTDFFIKYHKELNEIKQMYQVPEEMFYKPKMLSYTVYGTTELWLAILRANNMKSTCDFHYPYIWMYNPDRLKDLIKTFMKREGKY
jgi:hypothetical protein